MSKINDLIQELCPNGVKKYTIKDICLVTRGRVISKMELQEKAGEYPVYSSQTLNNGVFGKINSYDFDGEYVQWTTDGANAGSIFYRNGKFSVTNVCGLLKIKDEYLNKIRTDYLAYALTMESKKYVNYATSNPKLMSNVMADITILIPPIEIQNEIVRILDKFGELKAELEAELEARKSQYEFWHGQLFNKAGNTKIADVFRRLKGTSITAGTMKEIEDPEGDIRIFAGGQTAVNARVESINKPNIIDVPCVIVQSRGLIDFIYYDKPCTFKNEMWAYTCDNQITVKYLYYYLKNNVQYFRTIGSQMGSMPQISLPVTEKYNIYLPSLDEQKRIVNILDKFDTLVNDITSGIPAEIELRRQQYEYYRNKLLNFEELKVN